MTTARRRFNRALFSHGTVSDAALQRDADYLTSGSFDFVRPENMPQEMLDRTGVARPSDLVGDEPLQIPE